MQQVSRYPVPAGQFVRYPVLSGFGQILKIAIRYIPISRHTRISLSTPVSCPPHLYLAVRLRVMLNGAINSRNARKIQHSKDIANEGTITAGVSQRPSKIMLAKTCFHENTQIPSIKEKNVQYVAY